MWDYKQVPFTEPEKMDVLQEQGTNGWELCVIERVVYAEGGTGGLAIFKRPSAYVSPVRMKS